MATLTRASGAALQQCARRTVPLVVLAALGLAGCRTPAAAAKPLLPGEVRVDSLHVRFSGPGEGTLRLELSVEGLGEPSEAQAVDWELWLGNRYFSAGVERVSAPVDASGFSPVSLELPLHFPRLPLSPEPQQLKLSARGGVVLRGGAREERHPFERIVLASVPNAPVLTGTAGN